MRPLTRMRRSRSLTLALGTLGWLLLCASGTVRASACAHGPGSHGDLRGPLALYAGLELDEAPSSTPFGDSDASPTAPRPLPRCSGAGCSQAPATPAPVIPRISTVFVEQWGVLDGQGIDAEPSRLDFIADPTLIPPPSPVSEIFHPPRLFS